MATKESGHRYYAIYTACYPSEAFRRVEVAFLFSKGLGQGERPSCLLFFQAEYPPDPNQKVLRIHSKSTGERRSTRFGGFEAVLRCKCVIKVRFPTQN